MHVNRVCGAVERRAAGGTTGKAAVGFLVQYMPRDPHVIDLYFSGKFPLEVWSMDTGEKVELEWGASVEMNRRGGFELHNDFSDYSRHVTSIADAHMSRMRDAECAAYRKGLNGHLEGAKSVFQTPVQGRPV